jgi:hypothetical protein
MRNRSRFRILGSPAVLSIITSLWRGEALGLDPQRGITQYSHVVWDEKQPPDSGDIQRVSRS